VRLDDGIGWADWLDCDGRMGSLGKNVGVSWEREVGR